MKNQIVAALLLMMSMQATAADYDPNSCDFRGKMVNVGFIVHAQGGPLEGEVSSMQKGMDQKGFDANTKLILTNLFIYGYKMADKGYDSEAIVNKFQKDCSAQARK